MTQNNSKDCNELPVNNKIITDSISLKINDDNVNDDGKEELASDKEINTIVENSEDNIQSSEYTILTENEKMLEKLDEFVAGQQTAKRALITVVSCRNRRNKLADNELKDAIRPPHIIFYGPTGCGKSYLIGKLSEYKKFPFYKTEATQYTSRGYVGDDVNSMVKNLLECAIRIVRKGYVDEIKDAVDTAVYHRLAMLLLKNFKKPDDNKAEDDNNSDEELSEISEILDDSSHYQKMIEDLKSGKFDNIEIEIEIVDEGGATGVFDIPGFGNSTVIGAFDFSQVINKVLGKKNTKIIKATISNAIEFMRDDETRKRLNENKIIEEAKHLAQNYGIILIDEIDKIITTHENVSSRGGDVNKEGVQRDLLPLLDDAVIETKYGPIRTAHILFIGAGAFHMAKFSDFIPELQGRFPINVKLHPLEEKHFVEILKNKKYNLLEQHQEMLKIDGVNLKFTDDAINTIARITAKMNMEIENTGARRLRTIIDKILEDINFEAEKYSGKDFEVDSKYIEEKVSGILSELNLKKYVI